MFSEIEKQYKKGLQQRRFLAYYWPWAILIVATAILLDFGLGYNRWLVYGCAVLTLLILVLIFFMRDLHRASRSFHTVRDSKGITAKKSAYFAADDERRISMLADDLARHHINTKDDLALTLSYYQGRLPENTRPNLLSWILTAVITLVSIVVVAYDDSIGTINLRKLIPIFFSTVTVAAIILTPFIIARIISALISNSRSKVETILVEDLAYIYVNYEKYRHQLELPPKS